MLYPFATQSYKARALPFSAQRCVNYFVEAAPKDAKTPVVLYNAPGIASFADGLAGAIRGGHRMNGIAYVVAGNQLYSIASTGTATALGTINTSIGPVSMASNRADPQQLCFVDGTDGWIYDTTNGLQEIVDSDFEPANTVTFQDGYFIFSVAGTAKFRISNLDDGLTHDTSDFAGAEANADEVVAVWSSQQQLWVFKETITEIYYNSGNADFPFERIAGGVLKRGCAAAFSIAEDDNTLFWLGDDKIVYRAAGHPVRISTHAIEDELEKASTLSDAVAYFVTINGHKFYHLILPTARLAFVYDAATQLWHERESFGARHYRFTSYVEAYGKHLVGDAFQGRVGQLDMDTFTEFGGTMQGILTGPPVHGGVKMVFHKNFQVVIESGVGTTSGQEPQMWLDWSDDGGRTFSARKPPRSMGKIGEYKKRLRWWRLGSAYDRIYRLTVADAVKRSVLGTWLNED